MSKIARVDPLRPPNRNTRNFTATSLQNEAAPSAQPAKVTQRRARPLSREPFGARVNISQMVECPKGEMGQWGFRATSDRVTKNSPASETGLAPKGSLEGVSVLLYRRRDEDMIPRPRRHNHPENPTQPVSYTPSFARDGRA